MRFCSEFHVIEFCAILCRLGRVFFHLERCAIVCMLERCAILRRLEQPAILHRFDFRAPVALSYLALCDSAQVRDDERQLGARVVSIL